MCGAERSTDLSERSVSFSVSMKRGGTKGNKLRVHSFLAQISIVSPSSFLEISPVTPTSLPFSLASCRLQATRPYFSLYSLPYYSILTGHASPKFWGSLSPGRDFCVRGWSTTPLIISQGAPNHTSRVPMSPWIAFQPFLFEYSLCPTPVTARRLRKVYPDRPDIIPPSLPRMFISQTSPHNSYRKGTPIHIELSVRATPNLIFHAHWLASLPKTTL
ncbi:hypothetical protein EV401DRAFT_1039429 [Pisolithus croceorrhizus]|nr:hypothetical protein EV401DRAFT_1039429 [Pisolithus croceorrhizus]